MKRILGLCSVLVFVAACSSTPKKAPTYVPEGPLTLPPETVSTESTQIDYNSLQTHLGLDRAGDQVGYTEKAFNTCEAGYGYSRSQNCHREFFVLLQFKLSCRDSEGTISTILTDADTTPLSHRSVRWNLKNLSGNLQTDGEGYGQIRTISSVSQKRERVKLSLGNEFLYMRANEIKKVITPQPWCSQY